jgi:alpha-D-xyloside xylohydrolase
LAAIAARSARLLFAAAVALAALASPAGAATAPPVSWTASPSPFRLSFKAGGTARATEADATGRPGGRLAYRLADGSFHGLTQLLDSTVGSLGTDYRVGTDEPGRTATVSVRKTPSGAQVSLTLNPATNVVATLEAFAAQPGEHFLGGGERPAPLDVAGQAIAAKTSYTCKNTMPAPYFASSAGYGVSLRSTAIAALGFPGSTSSSACAGGPEPPCPLGDGLPVVQLCVKAAQLTYDLFLGTPAEVVAAYVMSVGRPQLPAPSQFELIKWRDIVGGPADLHYDIDRLRALNIPIGWVLLDNPWETGLCYGQMTFDPKFGDPATLTRSLHDRGVKFMLWVSPLIRQQWCPPPPQYDQSVLLGQGGKAYTLDLTDARARATFESSLRTLIGYGVDGFKGDRGDELDLEPLRLAGGSGVDLHNAYPLLFAQSVANAVRDTGKTASFATIFRAGAPGSASTVPGFWAGDQEGTFDGLRQAIRDGLSAGLAGYAVWGSDTGGYGATASAEVFVRWAQLSSVSPIFEVGGIGTNSTFWDYGAATVEQFRVAAVRHYELFPYLYELARTAHATGAPVIRPVALEYPLDANAWRQDLELLVGSELLAAPVTTPAGPDGTAQASVYLPAGGWVDLATGTAVRGGGAPFERRTPLAELPLYLRSGGVIPFAARTPLIWPTAWPTDALRVPTRGGWLYARGNGTATSSTAEFGSFRASTAGRTTVLTLRRAPAETQVLLAGRSVPVSITLGGRKLARSASVEALHAAGSGWALTRDPFPGIVLKLAPRAGSADVRLLYR